MIVVDQRWAVQRVRPAVRRGRGRQRLLPASRVCGYSWRWCGREVVKVKAHEINTATTRRNVTAALAAVDG